MVQWKAYHGYGMGASEVQKYVLAIMGKPAALRTTAIRLGSGRHAEMSPRGRSVRRA